MNTVNFQSVDFDKTPPAVELHMPERLIHKCLEADGIHNAFSEIRKHPVFFVDLPSFAISMTIGKLNPSGCSNRHRHTYETILYIIEGQGYSLIEDLRVEWEAGDAVYIPVWAWHHHVNLNQDKHAKYLACENAPMLQNMGSLALREEAK